MHTSNFDKILSYKEIADISYDRGKTVHFVGMGGVSMYSLAGLTADRGARVQGSDREDSPRLFSLRISGAEVFIGHIGENVRGADLVVYSHAILPDNPELTEAKRLGIPTVSRAEYLGALMLGYKSRIGVSGSHGKSSTTAILRFEILANSCGEFTADCLESLVENGMTGKIHKCCLEISVSIL